MPCEGQDQKTIWNFDLIPSVLYTGLIHATKNMLLICTFRFVAQQPTYTQHVELKFQEI